MVMDEQLSGLKLRRDERVQFIMLFVTNHSPKSAAAELESAKYFNHVSCKGW